MTTALFSCIEKPVVPVGNRMKRPSLLFCRFYQNAWPEYDWSIIKSQNELLVTMPALMKYAAWSEGKIDCSSSVRWKFATVFHTNEKRSWWSKQKQTRRTYGRSVYKVKQITHWEAIYRQSFQQKGGKTKKVWTPCKGLFPYDIDFRAKGHQKSSQAKMVISIYCHKLLLDGSEWSQVTIPVNHKPLTKNAIHPLQLG